MKILLANSTAYPKIGGVENSLRYIGRELIRAGHTVKIFCFKTSPDEPLTMNNEGMEIIRYPHKLSRWPHMQFFNSVTTAQKAIQKIMNDYKPDVIWSRSAAVGLGIVMAGYKEKLLTILPVTAKLDAESMCIRTKGMPWKRRLFLLSLWPLHYYAASKIEYQLLRASKVIVFSENMQSAIRNSYGSGIYKNIKIIPPGIDTDVFSPKNGKSLQSAIKCKYGIVESERCILYVGRFSTMKNLYGLIDAIGMIKTNNRLVLVGAGPEECRLKNYVKRMNLIERVSFVGKQSDLLPGFYSIARVFVNPSLIEPFGQTLLESLSCGTPVVAYGNNRCYIHTATSEIVKNNVTGKIVYDVKPSDLADNINTILSMPDIEYDKMSKCARDDIKERFSWSNFISDALKFNS